MTKLTNNTIDEQYLAELEVSSQKLDLIERCSFYGINIPAEFYNKGYYCNDYHNLENLLYDIRRIEEMFITPEDMKHWLNIEVKKPIEDIFCETEFHKVKFLINKLADYHLKERKQGDCNND